MAGCRALEKHEIVKILKHLSNPRDRALFVLGLKSGFRISELLSLKISDIWQNDTMLDRIRVRAMYMKGKDRTREVILHREAKEALRDLLNVSPRDPESKLFRSRQGDNQAITRMQASRVLGDAFRAAGLQGKLATHSMRKTFAETTYKILGESLLKTAKAMGHASVASTARYIEVDQKEIDQAILKG